MSFESVMSKARKQVLFAVEKNSQDISLMGADVKRLLPHRDPILLIDRIDTFNLSDTTLLASRKINPDDPVFAGHFPGEPVYPGVLLVEAMSQAAVCLQVLIDNTGSLPKKPAGVRLLRVFDALFQSEVLPNSEVKLLVKQIERRSYTSVYAAQVVIGDKIAAVTMVELYLVA